MKRISTLIVCSFFCIGAIAQTPQLLKNVNPVTVDPSSGSYPQKGIECNGIYIFPATDYNGNELFLLKICLPGLYYKNIATGTNCKTHFYKTVIL